MSENHENASVDSYVDPEDALRSFMGIKQGQDLAPVS